MARIAFQWLAWLFLALIPLQFFLAGLGVLGGEDIERHETLGHLLEMLVVVILLLALLAKTGRTTIIMSIVLLVLVILQSLWANEALDPMWLRSFHVFDASIILILAFHIAQRVGMPWRGGGDHAD